MYNRESMSDQAPRDIRKLVQRLARRIRTQRAIDGLVTGATVAAMLAMVALVLLKTDWIVESTFFVVIAVGCTAPLGLALLGWFRRLDAIALAQRLDRSHGLHDRLSTALALSDRGPQNDFERAQVADAARFVSQVEVRPAAPFGRPTDLLPLMALAGCVAALIFVRPPSHEHAIPQPPPIQHDRVLDSATIAMERDRLEQIRRELEGVQDPEAVELLEEIEELLEQVEEQTISEKDFLEELERLEKEYLDPKGEAERERLTQKLKEAAEELEKENAKDLAEEPAAQELVDALKEKDLERASKAMEKLAEKLGDKDLSEKQLERIARLMEKFADKIDPTNPALQKLMEKNKDLIDKLSKKFDAGKLNDKDKQRLERAKEELKKQQEQQKQEEERESTRELKKLRRLSQKAAEEAEKKAKGGNDEDKDKKATEEEEHNFQNEAGRKAEEAGKEASEQMGEKGEQQKRDAAREMARKQLKEMRESMKRSGGAKSGEGKEQEARKGQQMKEFLRRAKGEKAGKGEEAGPMKGDPDHEKKFAGRSGGTAEKGEDYGEEIKGESNLAGKGKGSRELGEETDLDSKRVDEKVDLEQSGKGPSRSEIIRSASEEGFATTEYKDVYVDYSEVVEEVMDKENIPAGYRYYIKRYFQLIKPQE